MSTPGTGLGDRCLAALELLGGEGTSAQVAELAGRRGRVPSQGQVAAVLRALASRAGAPVERAGGREGKAARWRLTGAGGGGA